MTGPSRLRQFQLRNSEHYYNLVFALMGRTLSMFNFGYAPVSDDVRADKIAAAEPYQAEMYAQVWRMAGVSLAGKSDALVVEVSSGLGGGLSFLRRLSGARVIGLERARTGRWAARRRGLEVRAFSAPQLDLRDGEADVIISVEAAHNYFTAEFAAEIERALRPGGVVVIADCPLGKTTRVERLVRTLLEGAGLRVAQYRHITENVCAAMAEDTPRKLRHFRWLPRPVRGMLMEALGCVPSDKFDSFIDGRRGYYLVRAEKRLVG